MAFTDPQTVTINAVPITLPRISDEASKSIYQSSDTLVKLTISQQTSGSSVSQRTRAMIRVDKRVLAVDPLSGENANADAGIYLVIDRPMIGFGFSAADLDYIVQGLKSWLTTANVLKVVGLEH